MNSAEVAPTNTNSRWRFLRDVAVFQLKMLLDNLRDFALMPISLVAAAIDLVYKGEREGALFYRVLHWGQHSEDVIDVYSPIKDEIRDFKINPNYTVDGVIARLENVLVREYEKGGTAASIKSAMNRAMDQLHRETAGQAEALKTEKLKSDSERSSTESDVRGQTSEIGNTASEFQSKHRTPNTEHRTPNKEP